MPSVKLVLLNAAITGVIGLLAGCAPGPYDPVDPFGLGKSLDPDYRAAYEANQNAPHIYDRSPTPEEQEQVHIACEKYVAQQAIMTVSVALTRADRYVPPNAKDCEQQHFNRVTHDAAERLHAAFPTATVAPY
jgi:hypothetical protein